MHRKAAHVLRRPPYLHWPRPRVVLSPALAHASLTDPQETCLDAEKRASEAEEEVVEQRLSQLADMPAPSGDKKKARPCLHVQRRHPRPWARTRLADAARADVTQVSLSREEREEQARKASSAARRTRSARELK